MKRNKIAKLCALLLVASLASCELKDELAGRAPSTARGSLELGVAVQEPTTKAETNDVTTFPVTITSTDDPNAEDRNFSYASYADMENPLSLLVGGYTVAAHTPGEMQTIMTTPYYKGETDMTITQGVTEQVTVTCRMANTKLTLNLSDNFDTYSEWTITFDDGTSNVLTFKKGDATYTEGTPIYWNLGESGATELTMNVSVTTSTGQKASDSRTFTKADAMESYQSDENNFVGGDALEVNINVQPEEPEPEDPTGSISFDIDVDVTFGDTNETVTIPVTPDSGGTEEPEEPVEPSGDITISDNGTGYLTDGVTVTKGDINNFPSDVEVVMDVPGGIKNVFVKIASTNTEFETLVSGMGLVDGTGMDLTSEAAATLASLFPLPQAGATEYTFTMSETLFGLLGNVPGFEGKHDFTLRVVDAADKEASATLSITVQAATAATEGGE